jgi:hypothetical protein
LLLLFDSGKTKTTDKKIQEASKMMFLSRRQITGKKKQIMKKTKKKAKNTPVLTVIRSKRKGEREKRVHLHE